MIVGDTVIAMRNALEPDPSTVTKDTGRRKPFEWQAGTLYVYALPYRTAQFGSMPGCLRTDFVVRAVYVIDSQGEEAGWSRSASIDDALEAKAASYIAALMTLSWRPAGVVVTGILTDPNFFSDLDENGISLDVTGYHIP